MILSRLISLILRFAEFVCAAVVLGLDAYFIDLYRHHRGPTGILGREIFIIVWAVLSVLLALVWMIPTRSSMLHVPADLVLSLGWFAAFGLLVNYLHRADCGGAFRWGSITHGGICNQFQATEAFSFIGACCWAASAIIGLWVSRSVDRRAHRHGV